ncbi:MAG: DUF2064 domain-containing protein [Pseudomonadota bacterium]
MTAVAIFVKTPGLSPIKTRLARTIGQSAAEVCYQKSAACVLDIVQSSSLNAYWAVAEAEALKHSRWQSLPCINQGEGSLGARMYRVHTELLHKHGSAMLIGADLPQISQEDLLSASDWLQSDQPRSVLGPACDGGFWLYGANYAHDESAWTSLPYSQPDTAERFIQAMPGGEWKQLSTRCDIDQFDDILRVVDELRHLARPSDSQQNLARWLSELGNG